MGNNSEENTKANIEQEAWDFVELVFTGKYYTDKQYNNLVKLAENLKGNEIALKYIDLDIQNLIYSAIIGNDKGLNKTLKQCYDTLKTLDLIGNQDAKSDVKINLPVYLRELKDLTDSESQDLYNNVVASYKRYYGVITKQGDLVNIKERLDDLDLSVENNSIAAKNNIKNNIIEAENNIKKELYPEFIAILGIFTAITFAIFGGMNLLSNLFQNMKSTHTSLGQALILAAIFGLIMWGITILLFYWISTIKKDQSKKFYKNWGFWVNILFIVLILLVLIIGLCFFFK